MLSENSSNHLQFFLSKITENKPFSFIRPNDGEYMICKGTMFVTQDTGI